MQKIIGINGGIDNKGYMIPCRGHANIINAPDEPNYDCGRPAAMCKNCKQVCCIKCLPKAKEMAKDDDKFYCCACNTVGDLFVLPSSWAVPISFTHTLPEDEQVSASAQRAADIGAAEAIAQMTSQIARRQPQANHPPPPPPPPPPRPCCPAPACQRSCRECRCIPDICAAVGRAGCCCHSGRRTHRHHQPCRCDWHDPSAACRGSCEHQCYGRH